MRIVSVLCLLGSYLVTASTYLAVAQRDSPANAPFTLEISANLENVHSQHWDFVSTGGKTIKTGSMFVVGIRKTNRTDHEIIKTSEVGGAEGYIYEVHDSRGNAVEPRKHENHGGWIVLGGPARVRGTKDMVLAPGETKIDSLPLSEWFDLSKPGKYTVQICQHVSNDPASEVIKSNVIVVDVLPPDAAKQ